MRKSAEAIFVAVLVLLCTISAFYGCTPKPPTPPQNKNYPFTEKELSEQTLSATQHIGILATAVGEFIENAMLEGQGVVDYEVRETVDVSGVPHEIEVRLFYDSGAVDADGKNRSLDLYIGAGKAGEIKPSLAFGVSEGTFYAEKQGADGAERFENDASFLASAIAGAGGGDAESFVKNLSFLLGYVSFYGDSIRYGVKTKGGVEVSELTFSFNVFSTLSSLVKLARMSQVDAINNLYPVRPGGNSQTDRENREKREKEIEKLTAKMNGLTQFLFSVNYDEIYKIVPVLYLNVDMVMHDKLAEKFYLSVTTEPKFLKSAVSAQPAPALSAID